MQIDRSKNIQGNLVDDPKQIQTKNGPMVVMTVAEQNQRFNRESGQYEDMDPTFYDVGISREKLGQNVLASVNKGDRVSVTGNYAVEPYVSKAGEPGLNHRIWADDVAASMQFNEVQVAQRPERAADRQATGWGVEGQAASGLTQQEQAGVEASQRAQQGPELTAPAR